MLCTAGGTQAAELIRCPDWQRYIQPAAELRSSPPTQSFDTAIAAGRTRHLQLASAYSQAGQGAVPAGTPVPAGTSAPNRASAASTTAESGAPLPLPAGFTRNARLESANANPTRTRRAARQTRQAANQAAATQAATICQYTVVAGDTLSKIATRRLGNGRRWPELARANALTATSILRIGQSLLLPCAPDRQQAERPQRGQRPERGQRADPPSPAAAPAPQSAARSQPAARPLPVWTARAGEAFNTVISRWAETAGYSVVTTTTDVWKLEVAVRLRGEFRDVVRDLVKGLAHDGRAPPVRLYPNKVVRIGL